MDMVEIPSHFFEFFLQDEKCLALCSKHYLTGDTMPRHVQKAVQQYWDFMPALDMNDTVTLLPVSSQRKALPSILWRPQLVHFWHALIANYILQKVPGLGHKSGKPFVSL